MNEKVKGAVPVTRRIDSDTLFVFSYFRSKKVRTF